MTYFAFQRGPRGREPVTFAERPYKETTHPFVIWSTLCKVPEHLEGASLDDLAKWYLMTKESK